MFSGLGSISDLNLQFAQFTSNLTNLDSLQDGQNPNNSTSAVTPLATQEKGYGEANPQTSECTNIELLEEIQTKLSLIKDLKAYLSVKDEQLQLKESEIVALERNVQHLTQREKTVMQEFSDYKSDMEERVRVLNDSLTRHQEEDSTAHQAARDKIKELENIANNLIPRVSDTTEPIKTLGTVSTEINSKALLEESRQACQVAQDRITALEHLVVKAASDLTNVTESEEALRVQINKLLDESRETNELMTKLRGEKDNATSSVMESQKELNVKTSELKRMEAELQGYLENIVELTEDRARSLERSSAAEAQCEVLEDKLRAFRESSEQHLTSASNSHDELTHTRELAETRAYQLQEAEIKVSTLTDKLKDMMHRFAELKSKSSLAAQQFEERIAEITKLAQAKDSEILSFRLKMENSERSGSDMRLKVGELAERYGDAQRELTRLRDVAEERQLETLALMEEREKLAGALALCEAGKDELQTKLKESELQAPAQIAAYESQIHELERELCRRGEESAEQIAQLRAELDATHSRLRADQDSAGNLDNYKKRAQLALKKANASNTTLTEEVQRLQVQLGESAARLADAQDTNASLSAELLVSTTALDSIRAERDLMERRATDLKVQLSQSEQALESKLREIDDILGQRVSLSAGTKNERKRESARMIDGQLRNIETTLSLAAAMSDGVSDDDEEKQAVDACSPADSDFAALPTEFESSVRDDNIRSSSWAMVAASGSRTTSTHPSTASMTAEDAPRHVAAAPAPTADSSSVSAADDRNDFRTALSSDSLLFISQLQSQLESVRKELSRRGIDLEAAQQLLQYEKDEKRILKNRVEELMAYLERTKQLHEGPDSAINMEYLKNCMFKFMCSSDLSEKRRLYPVIATILKLTGQEMKAIELAFQVTEERENEFQNTLSSIGSFATSSIGSFWGSATGSS